MPISPILLITLALLAGLTPLAIDLYLPSLPAIAVDLNSSIEYAQISVTVYMALFACSHLLLGPLSDRLGRRPVCGAGLLVFLFSALICATAPNMPALIAARAIQALGGAAVAVTVPALVRDLYEKNDYARVMSLVMLAMALAPLFAPTLGSLILTVGSWRWVFLVLTGFAVLASALFLTHIGETLPTQLRVPFASGQIVRRYGSILRNRAATGYLLTGAFTFGGMLTFIVSSPYLFITLHQISPGWFGLVFGINVAFSMLFSGLNARHARRFGAERLLRWGLLAMAGASLLGLTAAMTGMHVQFWILFTIGALYMSMTALVLGNSMAGFMAAFPQFAGTASALAGTARFGMGALCATLASLWHDGSARPALITMGLAGLLAMLSFVLLSGHSPHRDHSARAG